MKVALLGPYPTDSALPGGVEAVVLALARGLARCPGIELHVITAAPGLAMPVEIKGDGFPVSCVPRPRGGRLTGQRRVIRNLNQQITAFRPDVVHAHIAGIYAGAALVSGRPAIITLHGIIYREAQQAWPTASWPVRLRWLSDALAERSVIRRAQEIIAISPYVQAQFRGRTRARFHTIENPVDDLFFAPPEPLPGRERLIYVGRVIPRKGILALIRAFGEIAAARPQATLAIVGENNTDPSYASQCRALAEALGVTGRVEFAGALSPDAVRARYAASDIVLLASEQETAPVSIAEAMAAGRPVVATDVGGCAAMVADGVTGRVVPAKEPAALAAATIDLLSDPARCARMGAAGRAAAEARFRSASVVDATVALYRQILGVS